MKDKLFDYVERDNWVFNMSGVTKLICFLLLSASVMFTYDIRSILVVMILSFTVLRMSGITFRQMRICHLFEGAGAIRFGIYACSPEDSSFQAVFTNLALTPCMWLAHDGQQPDEDMK